MKINYPITGHKFKRVSLQPFENLGIGGICYLGLQSLYKSQQ